jgi:SnoaL-like protein
MMNRLSTATLTVLTLLVPTLLPVPMLAQVPADSADFEVGDRALISSHDRVEIQEKLLYAYAYTYDSKDCVGWSNLFTTDAVLESQSAGKLIGRDAILQYCTARQKNVVGNIKTRHNMMNIVFDQLTPRRAETRTYFILTWQKPGDQIPAIQTAGTYRDVIVKSDDGRWLFKERHNTP